ncbi:L-proline 4-hydroxylase [Planctomycetota bacterium]|nr:L-proline 4-hydroxylase [Planctomycetota bacterium]
MVILDHWIVIRNPGEGLKPVTLTHRSRRSPMLSSAQLAAYHSDGFLLVRDLFTAADLQPVMDEIAGKVDRLAARLVEAGRLKYPHANAGFFERLTLIERDCPGAATLLHTQGILEPALAQLWSDPRLLDIMEQLLGSEIAGHPVWNIRCKTPDNALATVPWHQDTAYLAEGSETTFQPTSWIPFLNATGLEGTLQVIRGSHTGKVFRHVLEREAGGAAGSWYLEILPGECPAGDQVTVDVPFGSVLLLNQLVVHRSTENRSKRIRWSVDLRYQRPSEPTGMDVIAPPVVLRSRRPGFTGIDWSPLMGVNRGEKLQGFSISDPAQAASSIRGPWMDRWGRRAGAAG